MAVDNREAVAVHVKELNVAPSAALHAVPAPGASNAFITFHTPSLISMPHNISRKEDNKSYPSRAILLNYNLKASCANNPLLPSSAACSAGCLPPDTHRLEPVYCFLQKFESGKKHNRVGEVFIRQELSQLAC